MRFPQSHTGVYYPWQFGLFVEINESSAVLLLVKREEELYKQNMRIYFFLYQGSHLNSKEPLEYPPCTDEFTLFHKVKNVVNDKWTFLLGHKNKKITQANTAKKGYLFQHACLQTFTEPWGENELQIKMSIWCIILIGTDGKRTLWCSHPSAWGDRLGELSLPT